MNAQEKEENLTLGILETVNNDEKITQRHIADELNVALGLANSYLKRCIKKGFIKIHQAPANRYLYYLTPKGFAEKSRLTAKYLSSSLEFYRLAKKSYCSLFSDLQKQNKKRIVFCGISELAEIASVNIKDFELEYVANYESDSKLQSFLGQPVWDTINRINSSDALVITTFVKVDLLLNELAEHTARENIFVPDFLGIR